MSDEAAFRILHRSTEPSPYFILRKPATYKLTNSVKVNTINFYIFSTLTTHRGTITSLTWNKTALNTPTLHIAFELVSVYIFVIGVLLFASTHLLYISVGIIIILRTVMIPKVVESSMISNASPYAVPLQVQRNYRYRHLCSRRRSVQPRRACHTSQVWSTHGSVNYFFIPTTKWM